jgi:hypothetical protein
MSNIQVYLDSNDNIRLQIKYNNQLFNTLPVSWEYVKLIKGWNNL